MGVTNGLKACGLMLLAVSLAACQTGGAAGESDELSAAVSQEDDVVDVDVQGHRGARGLKPENTLPAFEAALDLRVDTLEFDLHLSKDDRLVVWHDPFVVAAKCRAGGDADSSASPTTEKEKAPGAAVRSLTAEQLGRFQCDRNPDPARFPDQNNQPTQLAGADYRIVTLAELFDFVERYANSDEKTSAQRENARQVRFNIETKRDRAHPEYIGDGFDGAEPGVFERRLVELVEERGLVDRVTVQSFVPASLWAIRKLAPDLTLAVLEAERSGPLADLAEQGANVWSPAAKLVDRQSIQEARAAGLAVKPWTVNDTDYIRRLLDLGVDGIISDRPDRLLSIAR